MNKRNNDSITADIDTILVPIDESEESTTACNLGMALAKNLEASMTMMYLERTEAANRKTLTIDSAGTAKAGESEVEQLIQVLRGRYAAKALDGFPHAEEKIQPASRSVADEICEAASDMDAGLIVMALRHESTAEKLLQGSVVDEVLRRAPCPVTVTR